MIIDQQPQDRRRDDREGRMIEREDLKQDDCIESVRISLADLNFIL